MPEVEVRKIVNVFNRMNPGTGATNKFTSQVNVEFIPDEVRINVENYYNPGGDAAGLVLYIVIL